MRLHARKLMRNQVRARRNKRMCVRKQILWDCEPVKIVF